DAALDPDEGRLCAIVRTKLGQDALDPAFLFTWISLNVSRPNCEYSVEPCNTDVASAPSIRATPDGCCVPYNVYVWSRACVVLTPGRSVRASAQVPSADSGRPRWKSPLMLTAWTALFDSIIGVSPLTSTTSLMPPAFMVRSSVRFNPSRT